MAVADSTFGRHLDRVAIINATGPDPGIAHDALHTFWMRWRLDREHGHHDNHVIWGGPAPLIGDPNYSVQSLAAMDRWLAAIEQDTSDTPLAQKAMLVAGAALVVVLASSGRYRRPASFTR